MFSTAVHMFAQPEAVESSYPHLFQCKKEGVLIGGYFRATRYYLKASQGFFFQWDIDQRKVAAIQFADFPRFPAHRL